MSELSSYGDNRHFIPRVAEVPDFELIERQRGYRELLEGNIMPRARTQAERVLAHIAFELGYRAGKYSRSVGYKEPEQILSV